MNAGAPANRWSRRAQLLALFAFALLLRWHYVATAEPVVALSGDEQMFANYAFNVVNRGVYTQAAASAPAVPDSYRSPGVPMLVAASLKLAGPAWHDALTRLFALFGAATAVLFVLIAQRWLPWRWAMGVGVGVAVWPHGIVLADHALVEVPYALLLAVSVLLAGRVRERFSWPPLVGSGLAMAAAVITQPLAGVMVPAVALYAARSWRPAVVFLVAALSLPLAWSARDTSSAEGRTSSGRALNNLVLGSWPNYHDDWRAAHAQRDPEAIARYALIADEVKRVHTDRAAVFAAMRARFAADPLGMVAWYALRKPWALWDWSFVIGQGDLQVYALQRSPYHEEPAYRLMASLARAMNPMIFALALAALPLAWLRRRDPGGAHLLAAAALVVLVTLTHVIGDAEPRYSVALRGYEIALALTAAREIALRLAAARARSLAASQA